MKIVDAGHSYLLDTLDSQALDHTIPLIFVKRCLPPEKYPGNRNAYAGTTIQEVCRALIDRLKYVNNQERSGHSEVAISYLRKVILELEIRAAARHNRSKQLIVRSDIEFEPTCPLCGHIKCDQKCRTHDDEGREGRREGDID